MQTVLITGGTGLIGTALKNALISKGYQVIILTRRKDGHKSDHPAVHYANWDIEKQYIDPEAIHQADYIIHLAGANVAGARWTEKRKREIKESRVRSGELIVKALRELPNNVKAVLSASAIGWYGPDPEVPNPHPFKETDPSYNDFLGTTCKAWEEAIQPVANTGRRLVIFRTGIVLSSRGGAYEEFRKPSTFGATAILGSGKQVVSWIHIDDMTKLYTDALEHTQYNGVYNAVAPHPVTNGHLTRNIAAIRKRFTVPLHIPAWILKIMLGEMSIEVLKSTTVSNDKVQSEGFHFLYPDIDSAIRELEG